MYSACSVLCTQCTVHAVYCSRSVLFTQCTVHAVYCACSVLCMQCTVHAVYCARSVLCTQCTVHAVYCARSVLWTQCTVHAVYRRNYCAARSMRVGATAAVRNSCCLLRCTVHAGRSHSCCEEQLLLIHQMHEI